MIKSYLMQQNYDRPYPFRIWTIKEELSYLTKTTESVAWKHDENGPTPLFFTST